MNIYFLYYLLAISVLAFLLFGIDKRKAKKHQHRISEFFLLLMSLFGGSLGSVLGMFIFKHKISKPSFWVKLVAIILIQIVVLIYFFSRKFV